MRRAALVLATLVMLPACFTDEPDEGCFVGEVRACACPEGGTGLRTCVEDKVFEACACEGADGGTSDAGLPEPDGGAWDAGSAGTDAGAGDGGGAQDGGTDGGGTDGGGGAGTACTSDEGCALPLACIGGGCVAPVDDPATYADEAGSRPASYWWRLTFPGMTGTAERCCFDLDGDGTTDDAFGSILKSLAGLGADVQAITDYSVENGELVRIMDWRELPPNLQDGAVSFSLFDGALVEPMPDLASRQQGGVQVLLNPAGFGDYGALHQFNAGQLTGRVLEAAGGSLDLPSPIPGPDTNLRVTHARIQAHLRLDTGGCQGVCTASPALIGGAITIPDLATSLDAALRTCECAGIDPNLPALIAEGSAETGYTLTCTENRPSGSGTCESGDFCAQASMMCSLIPGLFNRPDLDSDGNGVLDAYSIGLEAEWSGALIEGLTP